MRLLSRSLESTLPALRRYSQELRSQKALETIAQIILGTQYIKEKIMPEIKGWPGMR